MDQIEIIRCTELPDRDALNPVLRQYYELVVSRLAATGVDVPADAPTSALAEFWTNAEGYLPPEGALVLAQTGDGEIVGCGMLKRFDARTGELKRLFVTDIARGTGTGRALVEAREAVAREMGLKRLVADTLTTNTEMQAMYPRLGFRQVEGPLETRTYLDQPQLRPHLLFFEKEL
jgi:N-acetylglutamate synthase-like GNAT family acetyltransferase